MKFALLAMALGMGCSADPVQSPSPPACETDGCPARPATCEGMSILTYAAACTATGCEYTASTQSCNPQYYTCYQSPGSDAHCGDAEGSCHMTVCPDQATCSSATTLSIQHTDCPPYPNLNCQPMGMPETVDCTATSQICMNGACVDP